eukprot:Hpha_TRINITY_DN16035_c4_g1::TRINITY_DN16035_c4_g1_i1::g.120390::m.120390
MMARRLRIVTWNILAHRHTHYDWREHGGKEGEVESEAQTKERHRRISAAIAGLNPDVLLLQEVDTSLVPLEEATPSEGVRRAVRAEILPGYDWYLSLSNRGEGTAIVLREGVFEEVSHKGVPHDPGHGWKTAASVRAKLKCSGDGVEFSSVHLPWGGDKEEMKRTLISKTLDLHPRSDARPRFRVFGGDFNTFAEELPPFSQILNGGDLHRIPTPADRCSARGQGPMDRGPIDHLFVSPDIRDALSTPPSLGALPQGEKGAWGDGEHDGSDHTWICIDLQLTG